MKLSLLFLLFLPLLFSKQITKNIYLSTYLKSGNKYITKFTMDYGVGSFEFRSKFSKSVSDSASPSTLSLQLHAMLDEDFEKVEREQDCYKKVAFSKYTVNIDTPTSGEWSIVKQGTLSQTTRPRIWFFMLTDCDNKGNELFNNFKDKQWGNRLQIEMTFYNTNGSHLSFEEQDLRLVYFIFLIALFVMIFANMTILIRYYKKEEEIDYPLLLINIAVGVEFLALFLELMHILIYESNGRGFFLFNLLNQIFDITAQFLITVIFILVAWGWTINYMNLEEFEFFVPILAFIGVLHVITVGLSRLTDDEFSKNHDYEGFAGYLILIMRVGLFAYFMMGIIDSYKKARFKIKPFVIKYSVLGTVYFLTFPLMVFITNIFVASYYRHKVVMIGSLIMELGVLGILTRVFTGKGGDYYDASFKGKTLLPSNKFE